MYVLYSAVYLKKYYVLCTSPSLAEVVVRAKVSDKVSANISAKISARSPPRPSSLFSVRLGFRVPLLEPRPAPFGPRVRRRRSSQIKLLPVFLSTFVSRLSSLASRSTSRDFGQQLSRPRHATSRNGSTQSPTRLSFAADSLNAINLVTGHGFGVAARTGRGRIAGTMRRGRRVGLERASEPQLVRQRWRVEYGVDPRGDPSAMGGCDGEHRELRDVGGGGRRMFPFR